MYMCHTPTHHTHSSNTHRRLYAVPLETIILSPIPRICDLAFRQEEFKSGPAQRSLNPASEVHAVFSNRDLPSTSGEVTKGNSDRLYSWRVSCTTLNNNKPYLVLGFIWGGGLWLLEGALKTLMNKSSLKLYMYIYTLNRMLCYFYVNY